MVIIWLNRKRERNKRNDTRCVRDSVGIESFFLSALKILYFWCLSFSLAGVGVFLQQFFVELPLPLTSANERQREKGNRDFIHSSAYTYTTQAAAAAAA